MEVTDKLSLYIIYYSEKQADIRRFDKLQNLVFFYHTP